MKGTMNAKENIKKICKVGEVGMRLIDADELEKKIVSHYTHKKIDRYDHDLLLHYLDVEMAPTVSLEEHKEREGVKPLLVVSGFVCGHCGHLIARYNEKLPEKCDVCGTYVGSLI